MEKIIYQVLKNGGATIDLKGKITDLDNGYMVSLKGYETTISLDIIYQVFDNLLVDYLGMIAFTNNYVGLWIDNNKVYFDISIKVDNLENAMEIAKANEQLAIWDNKNKKSIEMDRVLA